jgi:RimJ/RimL family protein N-acetyltransferase
MSLEPEYPIVTERLLLRPYRERDYDAFHRIHALPEVHRWLYSEARTAEESRVALDQRIVRHAIDVEGDVLQLALELRDGGAVVGDVMLCWLSEQHRSGEVGFMLHPEHQGRGYAREGATEMLRLGFEELGLHRIIGRCEARNAASAGLMTRLGMRCEAHLVENEWVKGEWQSELVYAMLDREWRALRRQQP